MYFFKNLIPLPESEQKLSLLEIFYIKKKLFTIYLLLRLFRISQIGYSQSASLLAHNLIKEVPTHRFRLGGLEAGDFLDEVKI